jgi:hypothetical protein
MDQSSERFGMKCIPALLRRSCVILAFSKGKRSRLLFDMGTKRVFSKCLGQENKALRAREANGTLSRKPSLSRHPLVTNDDEDSIIKVGSQKRPPTCAACGSTTSSNWWKAPKGLVTPFLCTFCGVAWRKYGDLTLSRAREREEVTGIPKPRLPVEKREPSPIIAIPPTKKPKVGPYDRMQTVFVFTR